jgi:hypothetical protein
MPQFPRLFDNYIPSGVARRRYFWPSTAARNPITDNLQQPPWRVPGVDYYVGIDTGTTLLAASLLPPSGSPRKSGSDAVIMDAANSVLDGYDLTGYQLQIRADNCVVRNCKFQIPSPGGRSMTNISGTGWLVEYCSFYGNYFADDFAGGLFVVFGGNGGTLQYNYMERAYAHFLNLYGGSDSNKFSAAVQFNVIHNSAGGGHPDWLALGGPPSAFHEIRVNHNLWFNIGLRTDVAGLWGAAGTMPRQGTQGIGPDGWNTATGQSLAYGPYSVSNNAIVALAGASINHLIGSPVGNGSTIRPGFSIVVNDNYVDPTGAATFLVKGSTTTSRGNVNMVTGANLS